MKKLLLILFGVLMTLPSFAFEYTYEGQTLSYTVLDEYSKTVSVKGYGNSGVLMIPEIAQYGSTEYTVTEIDSKAFSSCSWLTEVTIPNSVTKIGYEAFFSCSRLKSVTIGNSVKTIGAGAFSGCSALTSVEIPNSVETIDTSAFGGCTALTSVEIPNSVKTIGNKAFSGCNALTSVTIGNTVETIGNEAFSGCSALTSVTIGNSVTSIGSSAFKDCTSLSRAEFSSVESLCGIYFGNYQANPLSITHNLYIAGEEVKDLVIPDAVASIRDYAFDNCTGLTSVIIGNSVEKIGRSAFYGCSGLTSVTIGDSVETIDTSAFDGCTSLTSVTIGNSVKTIGGGAFSGCSAMTSVEIPNSVKTIGVSAFYGCSALTSVTIGNSVTSIGVSAFEDCTSLSRAEFSSVESLCGIYFGNYQANPLSITRNLYIAGEEVKDLVIPNSVTSIRDYAFDNCTGLTSVIIGNSVEKIGRSAFYGCSGLKSVVIPGSVNRIGNDAFKGCSGLVKSAYPNTLSDYYSDGNPFSNGTAVAYNPFGAMVEDGWIYRGEKNSIVFAPCTLEGEYVIPNSVTEIGDGAFDVCTGLTSVTIPNSVKEIGYAAFRRCTGLTSLTIPESVTKIGSQAFDGCTGLTSVNVNWEEPIGDRPSRIFNSETLSKATLNVPADAIPAYASTYWWKEFKIHAANGFAVIDYNDGAFNYALVTDPKDQHAILVQGDYSSMTTVNIPESFTVLSEDAAPVSYNVTAIGALAFYGCTGLTSVTIPNSVTSIGAYAFSGCSGLTRAEFASVESLCSIEFNSFDSNPLNYAHNLYIAGEEVKDLVIPNSVTSIGDYAFSSCRALTSVEIPNSVKTIGDYAFSSCTGLTSVIIPNTVTEMGDNAFSGCTGLVKSAYPNTLRNPFPYTTVAVAYNPDGAIFEDGLIFGREKSSILFAPYNFEGEYVIPNSVKEIGYYAFCGCTGLTSVTIPNSVTSIGRAAFEGCSGLTKAEFASVESLCSIKFVEFNGYSSNPLLYAHNLYIAGEEVKDLVIPNTVKTIGEYAFKGCRGLTSVTIGNSVTEIYDETFKGCSGLTEVVFAPSVVKIGASAFADNTALASIIMGHKVKTIGDKAYDGCPANTVYITAPTPPGAATLNTFSNSGSSTRKLYIQSAENFQAYKNSAFCGNGYRFSECYVMVEPTEMKYEGEQKLNGEPGDTLQLKATLMPENVTLPQVFWRSTNPDIATVDNNGLVTLHADLEGETGGCKIIAESLYANGPVVEFDVTVAQNGVDDILVDSPADESAIDYASSYDVYNLSGVWVGDSLEGLAHGFYVVRQGGIAKKVAVK